jgi:hypothetical protein
MVLTIKINTNTYYNGGKLADVEILESEPNGRDTHILKLKGSDVKAAIEAVNSTLKAAL